MIPTYNRRGLLGRALRSVLEQADGPDEIVVVDDGSTDGTAEWLTAQFADRVRVIRQENGGVSIARRRGVEAARGEWIAFLDSDDEWAPGRMTAFRAAVAQLPADVPWVFGDTRLVHDDGDGPTLFQMHGLDLDAEVAVLADPLPSQFPFQLSLLQSSVIRREALLGADSFAEGLRSSEDFLLSFTLALRNRFAAVTPVVTRFYRTSDLASSSLDAAGSLGPDYFHARVIAFDAAVRVGRDGDWRRLHEEAVRGWCRALSFRHQALDGLPWRQFRHRVSFKAIAFAVLAAVLGHAGVAYWNRLASRYPAAVRYAYPDLTPAKGA